MRLGFISGQLLAHQGGWDEMLMVVGPLGVVGFLLWLVNKRISGQLEDVEIDVDEREESTSVAAR